MVHRYSDNVQWYSWESMDRLGIRAGTTCRSGRDGRDFNLALHVPGNEKEILSNREEFCRALSMDRQSFVSGEQVHSCHSCILDKKPAVAPEKTDALILKDPTLLGAVFTADCLPVVLYDESLNLGAVIHAGWRGIAGGIIPRTMKKMHDVLGCVYKNIHGATGPAIGACCYQVDIPVYSAVTGNFPETEDAFTPDGAGHWKLSLETAAVRQMVCLGMDPDKIETAGICTCCSDHFYSWRGDGPETGRMATFLSIKTVRPE